MYRNPTPFKILNASAGSGKTYSLVLDYLTVILSDANNHEVFRRTLAITFTNKAVEEMKTRILEALAAFTAESIPKNYTAMFGEVSLRLNVDKSLLQDLAKKVLQKILYNYSHFNVSTIDKFNHSLIRAFAQDLKLPSNFEVLLSAKDVLKFAVDEVISRSEHSPYLVNLLVRFALDKLEDGRSWDITKDIAKVAELITKEEHYNHLKGLKGKTQSDFSQLQSEIKAIEAQSKEAMKTASDCFFKLIETRGIDPNIFSGKYVPGFFEKAKKLEDLAFGAGWQANIADKPLYAVSKKHSIQDKRALEEIQPEVAALFYKVKLNYFTRKLTANMRYSVVPFSLLNEVSKIIEEVKDEKHMLLISEFNTLISEAIRDQPAPFIYERLGARYKYFFIDEFQDTSKMQWENMLHLPGNALESELEREGKTGSLLLVGDPKQAIYRWRGGDPKQCISLFNKTTNPFQVPSHVDSLGTNYRSFGNIVEFNNVFFRKIADVLEEESCHELYSQHSYQNVRNGNENKGYVEISFVDKSDKETHANAQYSQKVLEIIQRVKALGYEHKDICILARKTAQVAIIASFLTENNIAVTSTEALLLKESPEVVFLNTLIEYTLFPKNKTLHFKMASFVASQKDLTNHDFIYESLEPSRLFQNHNFCADTFSKLPLFEAVTYAIELFEIPRNAYVSDYLQLVFECSIQKNLNFYEFLALWDSIKKEASVRSASSGDAIKVMTIHKSKGLEFPVVIYPFINTEFYEYMDYLWLPKNDLPLSFDHVLINERKNLANYNEDIYDDLRKKKQLDAINILYVAMTRAEQQLYMVSEATDADYKEDQPKPLNKVCCYNKLLITYLKSIGEWHSDKSVYCFGTPSKAEKHREEPAHKADTLCVSELYPKRHIIDVALKPCIDDQSARERGNQTHRILKNLKTKTDIPRILNNALYDGSLDPENLSYVENMLIKLVSHPELGIYYTNTYTILNERELIYNAKVLRPDRVLINQDNAVVIDYKTGSYNESYIHQIQDYANALSAIGKRVEHKILVFLDSDIKVVYA